MCKIDFLIDPSPLVHVQYNVKNWGLRPLSPSTVEREVRRGLDLGDVLSPLPGAVDLFLNPRPYRAV